jgi:4-diphosphocytidyl-2-C-methyl-D-erythritol kinase
MNRGLKVSFNAPAKINLGLEVLGRRGDGFHEIRTVMTMVSLCDTLTVANRGILPVSPVRGVDEQDNLIAKALSTYRACIPQSPELSWSVEKRVPVAAGLGGASSDAAAAIRAAALMSAEPPGDPELHRMAGELGSDVPFFLRGPAAVASGRGTELQVIAAPKFDLLFVVPKVELPQKTRLLYSLLKPSDFTDGSRTDRVVQALKRDRLPTSELLQNAFSRALCEHVPGLQCLQRVLSRDIGLPWGLSGAGPSHYIIAPKGDHEAIIDHLDLKFEGWLASFSVHTLDTRPEPTLEFLMCA